MYHENCFKYGLLEDGTQWDSTLADTVTMRTARSLRQPVAVLLHTCELSDPVSLLKKYKENLSDDFKHYGHLMLRGFEAGFSDESMNRALIDIEDKMFSADGNSLQTYGLSQFRRTTLNTVPTGIIGALERYVSENEPKSLRVRHLAYNTIFASVRLRKSGLFLDAPGGRGKTFFTKFLLAKVQKKKLAVAVASSEIAATILSGGRTADFAFNCQLILLHLIQRPVASAGVRMKLTS